jgi:hypothetical protein
VIFWLFTLVVNVKDNLTKKQYKECTSLLLKKSIVLYISVLCDTVVAVYFWKEMATVFCDIRCKPVVSKHIMFCRLNISPPLTIFCMWLVDNWLPVTRSGANKEHKASADARSWHLILEWLGHDYKTSACRLLTIGLSMEVSNCDRREGNIHVMDIAPLHCVKINHKQRLFVVIALYMCVRTTDLTFVTDVYCINYDVVLHRNIRPPMWVGTSMNARVTYVLRLWYAVTNICSRITEK